MANTVVEPVTGLSFATPLSNGDDVIFAVGVRQKTIAWINVNVYACAFYARPGEIREEMRHFCGMPEEDLLLSSDFLGALISSKRWKT